MAAHYFSIWLSGAAHRIYFTRLLAVDADQRIHEAGRLQEFGDEAGTIPGSFLRLSET